MNPDIAVIDDPLNVEQPQTLVDVAKRLIEYRKERGCAAEVIVRMALKIGYDAGVKAATITEENVQAIFSAGYQAGRDEAAGEQTAAEQADDRAA
jgi:hypothetical protein